MTSSQFVSRGGLAAPSGARLSPRGHAQRPRSLFVPMSLFLFCSVCSCVLLFFDSVRERDHAVFVFL